MIILKPNAKSINLAIKFLRQGKAVVYPTDTAYGLGVDATSASAVKRLFQIKRRRPTKPVHIVVADLKMARKYALFLKVAEKLFKKFLPGPITLILKSKMKGSAGKLLSAESGTIGIRMPKNRIALELVKKLGRPITATSANLSDAPTAYSILQLKRQFGKVHRQPDAILDSGKLKKIKPSTMVQLLGDKIKIVRPGPISEKQIEKFLKTPR